MLGILHHICKFAIDSKMFNLEKLFGIDWCLGICFRLLPVFTSVTNHRFSETTITNIYRYSSNRTSCYTVKCLRNKWLHLVVCQALKSAG